MRYREKRCLQRERRNRGLKREEKTSISSSHDRGKGGPSPSNSRGTGKQNSTSKSKDTSPQGDEKKKGIVRPKNASNTSLKVTCLPVKNQLRKRREKRAQEKEAEALPRSEEKKSLRSQRKNGEDCTRCPSPGQQKGQKKLGANPEDGTQATNSRRRDARRETVSFWSLLKLHWKGEDTNAPKPEGGRD